MWDYLCHTTNPHINLGEADLTTGLIQYHTTTCLLYCDNGFDHLFDKLATPIILKTDNLQTFSWNYTKRKDAGFEKNNVIFLQQ